MLGFASTVMASWEVLLVLFKLTLMTGGFPNLFWGFIVNVCGMLFVYASIAELASMYVINGTVGPRTVVLTIF
jgi:choline transport protein